jgi:uncharacterized membrane protein
MNWILIALLAPLLWAITNFIDKYLISNHFKSSIGTLIVYSGLIGFPVSLLIVIFNPGVLFIAPLTAFLIILNGILFSFYLFPYFKALSKADASVVVPIFQSVAVFSYFLAFFVLGEVLSKLQLIGAGLVILGAIGISIKFHSNKIHLTKDVLVLQLLASFIIALNTLLFKFFAAQVNFWAVSFWQYVGFTIFALFLLVFIKSYREKFIQSFKINKGKILGLNSLNEAVNIGALIIFTFATLLAPLSLVWAINGFQPVFVFLIGLFLTLMFPHIIKEEINARIIIQKIIFMIIIFVGTYLIYI